MSKVIHLSDGAHAMAKTYCKQQGCKMSEWVGSLIEDSINGPTPVQQTGIMAVEKRQSVKGLETNSNGSVPEHEAVYAAPPFWAGSR
jgi:hypothetical protein